MKYVSVLALLMVGLIQCSEAPDQVSDVKQDSSSQKTAKATPEKGPHDGVYLFNMEKYKAEQLKHPDSVFKKMSEKDLGRMMQVFRPFKIEVEGKTATATFSHDVIKGKLKTLEKDSRRSRLFMTPMDQKKRDQTVTLIIEGDDLVLDPGKKETDKMYFKRVQQ